MNSNKLKLNIEKTEIMPVGSTSHLGLDGIKFANTRE